MKKSILLLLLVCSVCFQKSIAQSVLSDEACLKQLRGNYIRSMISTDREKTAYLALLSAFPAEKEVSDQNIVELYQRFPTGKEEVEKLISELGTDGSWPDIDYRDKKRSGWEPKKHTERILILAKYYYETRLSHPEQMPEGLTRTIHRSLDFWFQRNFTCLNWWYNQIGIPRTLGPAFLLLEEELTSREKELAIREMMHSKFGMTGQNKVWLAGNVLIRGLLQNDYALVKAARDTIVSEIVLGKPEGIKSDWSFHQHGPQQQMGNYGLSFLANMCTYAELFAHTPLALSEEQQGILFSFFREGYRWFVWRGRMEVNALNRQLFHNADLHKAYTLLFAVHSLMQGSTGEQTREIKEFIHDNFFAPGSVNKWKGNKVFWDSDETVHRTSHWMASVKMASSRVIGTELVNEDNKKGYYLGDGALYVYVDGDEYHNIFPFWDWRKIPGITCVESAHAIPTLSGAKSRNHTAFAGGVTNGSTGLSAMQLNRHGVRANKAWIFTDDFVLCLGNDISGDSLVLTTAMDQVLKSGNLWVAGAGRQWQEVEKEYRGLNGPVRFYHRNTGYIVLQADSCIARVENREGQWHDVMGMYSPQKLHRDVVTLYIKHREQQPAAYQYLVLPAATRKETMNFKSEKIQVIRNDAEVQVVVWKGMCYVGAYQSCQFRLPDGEDVEIEKPGLYLIPLQYKTHRIYASDPARTERELLLKIGGRKIILPLNEHGFTFNK